MSASGLSQGGLRASRRAPVLPYLMLAPCVLLVLSLLLYPLVDESYISLTHWRLLYEQNPQFVGLRAYQPLLNDSEFWSSLWRCCEWTVGTLAVEYLIGFPLALALSVRTRLTGLFTGLMLLPWVTPTTVAAYAWVWVLDSQIGILHGPLQALHLAGATSPLTAYNSALLTETFISGWKGAPFMVVALLAALKGISAELYDAAAIDGAGFVFRHLAITLPEVRRTALVTGMLLGIYAFNSFDLAWLMGKGGPANATELVGVYLFKTYSALDWGYAANIGVAMFLFLVVMVVAYLRVAKPYRE
jgi:multiple sugar transport system permease protein